MKNRWSKIVIKTLKVILGVIFVFAGALKVRDPEAFKNAIESVRVLPVVFTKPLAYLLPWLEIWAGGAIASEKFRLGAPVLVASLLIAFLAVIASAWIRGLDINCGCFGDLFPSGTSFGTLIARNLALLAAAVSILVCEIKWRLGRLEAG